MIVLHVSHQLFVWRLSDLAAFLSSVLIIKHHLHCCIMVLLHHDLMRSHQTIVREVIKNSQKSHTTYNVGRDTN
jgi:hypothetical protein